MTDPGTDQPLGPLGTQIAQEMGRAIGRGLEVMTKALAQLGTQSGKNDPKEN
jgi:hypothetical protein